MTTATMPTVVHHPAAHPYVDRLSPAARVVTVDDIWDTAAFTPDVDVVHLHFGFEALSRPRLTEWIEQLAARGISLVYTLHDLDNPHLCDQREYHLVVRDLVEAAAHVFTLTPAVAALAPALLGIDRRLEVVPHPPVVDPHVVASIPSPTKRHGVYVHAASVRPNLDLDRLVGLATAAAPLGGLDVHVRDGSSLPDPIVTAVRAGGGAVTVEPRLTDVDLWRRVRAAALVALPYSWGTHSGLLEAATDLGTPTIAPPFGGYADQGAATFEADLAGALGRAAARPVADGAARHRCLARTVATHRQVYEGLRS